MTPGDGGDGGRRRRAVTVAAVTVLLLASAAAKAVLTIEVTKGVESAVAIAVVPFQLQGVGADLDNRPGPIIEADLAGSGKFAPVARGDFISRPHERAEVKFKDWRLLKAEALVVGRVIKTGADRFEVRFQLIDVFRERVLAGKKFVVPGARLRKVAHQISDVIYEALTGTRGAFDTRIAFVTVRGAAPRARYLLQVADADGHNARTILESPQPILSPAWSPDGDKLAYVSFEKNRSMIYIQRLRTGRRERIAGHHGINGAPAWSPNGRQLALTLSKDGNPDIYLYDLATRNLRRLTRHPAIDTEPAWSPDGGTIAFTSGRSVNPQIYRVAATGGVAQRVTFDGKYNANANYSHDGKSIALVTNHGNGYQVALYSAADRSVTALTETAQDESPTFAPNGEMILYATQSGGAHVLAAVSPDGRVKQILRLLGETGQVREPAWSPFTR